VDDVPVGELQCRNTLDVEVLECVVEFYRRSRAAGRNRNAGAAAVALIFKVDCVPAFTNNRIVADLITNIKLGADATNKPTTAGISERADEITGTTGIDRVTAAGTIKVLAILAPRHQGGVCAAGS
jgi:hypothetical protein